MTQQLKRGYVVYYLSGKWYVRTLDSDELIEMTVPDGHKIEIDLPVLLQENDGKFEVILADPMIKRLRPDEP